MNEELLKYISRKEVQDKRGEWQDYDVVIHYASLWIPLAVDPFKPERGVWEWIDWNDTLDGTWNYKQIAIADILKCVSGKLYMSSHAKGRPGIEVSGDPLTTLLKVFLWQKGVEV